MIRNGLWERGWSVGSGVYFWIVVVKVVFAGILMF